MFFEKIPHKRFTIIFTNLPPEQMDPVISIVDSLGIHPEFFKAISDTISKIPSLLPDIIVYKETLEYKAHVFLEALDLLIPKDQQPYLILIRETPSNELVRNNCDLIDGMNSQQGLVYLKNLLIAKKAHFQLELLSQFTHEFAENATDPLIFVNALGLVQYINPPAIELVNRIRHLCPINPGAIGSDFYMDIPISDLIPSTVIQWQEVLSPHAEHFEIELLHPQKQTLSLAIQSKPIRFSQTTYWSISIKDISEKRYLENEIKNYAFYDPLTHLPNRILLRERLNNELARIQRAQSNLGVFFIDLDDFKYINDTLGHLVGDQILIEVGRRLQSTLRAEDFIARLSADEFLVLTSGLTKSEYVGKIADNLLYALREPYVIDDKTLHLTASIGISVAPEDGTTEAELIANAEIAMFRAKGLEKGSFESFTHELSEIAQQRMLLEHDLRKAIENHEFVVYYQPKVNALTEKIVGMEALVRWQHPQRGLVPPNLFIPLAEETGLIVPIGDYVLEKACQDNLHLQACGFEPLVVSVNLSMKQFEKVDLVDKIQKILKRTQMAPQWLELEITESIAMLNLESTLQAIRTLQKLGIQFSIDDFGTGYSSLSKLGLLAVDKLKIDRSFISNMTAKNQDSIIATTILTLGKHLNLQIIAEGVETIEQVAFLRKNNCDELQGYFYGKPMPFDDFMTLLGGPQHV